MGEKDICLIKHRAIAVTDQTIQDATVGW